MERGEMMRRERERLEGDKKRQGWEKGEEGYAHVQLPEVSFEGRGCKIFPPLFPSTPLHPPRQRIQLIVHKYRRQ